MLHRLKSMLRPRAITMIVAALILATQFRAGAHDIPSDVSVQTFLKPEGQVLSFLVRVPMRACRDIDFPTRDPGYVDLSRADASLRDAATLWISDNVDLYEGDTRLDDPRVIATRVSLESDRFFDSYDDAIRHITGAKLPLDTELYWNQGLLDVLFQYPINSDSSNFSIQPRFAGLGLRVTTVVRFLPPGGAVRAFEFDGDPGLVRLDPRWHQAASRFVAAGFFHILEGTDHLLFLICLVIP